MQRRRRERADCRQCFCDDSSRKLELSEDAKNIAETQRRRAEARACLCSKCTRRLRRSKEIEDIAEVERRVRRANRDMWTPPGQRTLAEPPEVDWSRILEEKYSDGRLSALFRDDSAKRSQAKSLWGEPLALREYLEWCQGIHDMILKNGPLRQFHRGLRHELDVELEEVEGSGVLFMTLLLN